ncbi:MAG: gluconate 2-dehydrogenase subunit 3 family protein [Parasphingorhabdus sp.]
MSFPRRDFLLATATATGGAILYSKGLAAMLADSEHSGHDLPMVDRVAYIDQPVDAFSTEKRELVSAMAETLLPRTDTPGAIDAKVPKFLELLYDQWMAEPEKQLFDQGLMEADKQAQAMHRATYTGCSAEDQKAVLERMEADQSDHAWFNFGGTSVADNQNDIPFMALFKEITVVGFFMSEVGAQQVLRYDMMPGTFDGDIGLGYDESSWASVPFM